MALGKDLALVASGPAGQLLNQLMARKVHRWVLKNVDTQEKLEGQFGPVNPTEIPGNPTYAEHTSLNRDKPIVMFTHGTADSFSFGVEFFAVNEDDDSPEQKIAVLKSWIKRDADLARPPIVTFWIGDNKLAFGPAVIASLGEIKYYDPPKHGGGVRALSTAVTLRAYTAWKLESTPAPETRYHRVKEGEYFEMLAWIEYKTPMLGVEIRRRNPEMLDLSAGDTVPLPSAEAIRTVSIQPSSITFKDTQTTKPSPQKDLRAEGFDRRGGDYISGILPEGL